MTEGVKDKKENDCPRAFFTAAAACSIVKLKEAPEAS